MSLFLKAAAGAITTTAGGMWLYRYNRSCAQQRDKLEDPSLMNAREKFTHYASVDGGLMTTEDFVVSMTAGKAGADTSVATDRSSSAYDSLHQIFRRIDANGDEFLSYQEYCMFVSLISTPREHFRVAFKMFDLNENGKVDIEDFKEMMQALVVDPTVKLNFKGGVCESFFGKNYDKSLGFDQFIALVDDLRKEMRTAEFKSFDVNQSGSIKFSNLQKLFGLEATENDEAAARKVTLHNYHNLVNVLLHADTVERAMQIYDQANDDTEGLNKAEFVRALRCANIRLAKPEVDLFFDLFDSDNSGRIDSAEFASVSKRKRTFFASALPSFDQPQRNAIQQWAYCMQQKQ